MPACTPIIINMKLTFNLSRFVQPLTGITLSILLTAGIACADNEPIAPKAFEPTEQQKITYQTAMQFVASYHYTRPKIDDEYSSKALKNYLDIIDPAKVYFLKSDIDRFTAAYKNQLDDGVFTGDLTPAFDIFNTYQKRLYDRIQFSLSLLKTPYQFSEKDSFETDRENAQYATNFTELDNLWKLKIKYECLLSKAGKNDSANKYLEDVRKRYENLLKMSAKTKGEDVLQLYMNAFLEITDPHTNYYLPRTAENFNQSMSLSLEGIGAQLQTENEYTKIREIIKGGPADKSKKLFAGDKITGVSQHRDSDFVNVVDWRIDDVVSLIRGKKGTLVRLQVVPASEPNTTKVVELTRDKIVLEDQSAKCSIKEVKRNGKKHKIGVISIPTFYIDFAAAGRGEPNYKSTTRDVKKLIDSLKTAGIDGLVIDLRNNGGGSLQEAVELTGLFIPSGPVVQVKYADGNRKIEQDQDKSTYYDGPLTVLVNKFSASASEIFSAAIQDYNRGMVIGERTYGKGTVQNMVDLNEFIQFNGQKLGQVKLTIAKFYRVNGGSTQHKGVTPDIEFPTLYAAEEYGEDASPYALPWDQIASTAIQSTGNIEFVRNDLIKQHQARIQKEPEFTYLLEDIKLIEENKKRRYVSLNELQFKAELDQDAALKKQRDEARKKDRKELTDKPDLILEEAEEVLLDMVLTKQKK